jgi:hypothetical protein
MRFLLRYRRHLEVQARITHDRLVLGDRTQRYAPLPISVNGERYRLDPGGGLEVPLERRRPEPV